MLYFNKKIPSALPWWPLPDMFNVLVEC